MGLDSMSWKGNALLDGNFFCSGSGGLLMNQRDHSFIEKLDICPRELLVGAYSMMGLELHSEFIISLWLYNLMPLQSSSLPRLE